VELAPPGRGAAVAAALAGDGVSVGLVAPRSGPPCQPGSGSRGVSPGVHQLLAYRNVAQLARALYAALRAADDLGLDLIVVEEVDESGLGRAVMDRLRRAAAG
jgi:L-threonylcarbamoyladenylate synthase